MAIYNIKRTTGFLAFALDIFSIFHELISGSG